MSHIENKRERRLYMIDYSEKFNKFSLRVYKIGVCMRSTKMSSKVNQVGELSFKLVHAVVQWWTLV